MTFPQQIISVVIPILHITPELSRVRNAIQTATTPIEVLLIVDPAEQATIPLFPNEKKVTISGRGRGRALAEGIRQSIGDIIIFVHADTILPPGWDLAIRNALTDTQVIGGGFSLTFDVENNYLHFLTLRQQLRIYLFRELWGDQAIFVRSHFVKQQISKIAVLPIMEDVQLSKLMSKNGKVIRLKEAVVTSAATFRKHGFLRNTYRIIKVRLWYELGGDPQKIYDYYYKK
jgi:glycosyltransferase involved in cell wall biosynthesis